MPAIDAALAYLIKEEKIEQEDGFLLGSFVV
jgi:hypothetical protein